MLAVTSTICVVIVLVVAVLVFYIARRRRAKKKSSPLESLRRTALSTRNGVRGSRVRRNGEVGMYTLSLYFLERGHVSLNKRMDVV